MTRKKLLLLALSYLSLQQHTVAQNIHYNPFYSTPTMLNPAFAGMFDGQIRAGALYRNQWSSVTVPYYTIGLSADMTLVTLKDGSYIAGGIQAMKDQAGDGNLANFTATASVSYHRSLYIGSWLKDHPIDIGVGIQAGYDQVIIDARYIYFNPGYYPEPTPGIFGMGNTVRVSPVALGLSISQRMSDRFNYTIGISANNIAATGDDLSTRQRGALGLDRYYSIVAGATWQPTKRLKIAPALIYTPYKFSDFSSGFNSANGIAGCEFGYRVSGNKIPQSRSTSVFAAGWYRSGQAVTYMAGIQQGSFKLGIGYDQIINTPFRSASNGSGGFELSLRYIAPKLGPKTNKRYVPGSI